MAEQTGRASLRRLLTERAARGRAPAPTGALAQSPAGIGRRGLLQGAAASVLAGAAVAGGVATAASASAAVGQVTRDLRSIQMYTLRQVASTDLEGTLETLAEIGYRSVELAGTYGLTAAQLRTVLDRHGLRATSSHVSLQPGEAYEQHIEDALTLGQTHLTSPGSWLAWDDRRGWEAVGSHLETVGAAAAPEGIRVGYHNHDHEMQGLRGQRPVDIIMRASTRAHVHLELDLYWVVTGRADPLELLNSYRGRVRQLHVKDRANGTFANPGEGTIDFPRIFAAGVQAGVRDYIVEHDSTQQPLETARIGYEYLTAVRF